MNREEALALLRELKAAFDTLESLRYVFLINDESKDSCELDLGWLPQQKEKSTLVNLATEHGLEVDIKDNHTVLCRHN